MAAKKYLGLGPSAHSYNQKSREWNISNLVKYIEGVNSQKINSEAEVLSLIDISNEFVITNLRTKWGVDLGIYKTKFSEKLYQKLMLNAKLYIGSELEIRNNKLCLTPNGIMVSDSILEKLFVI